MCQLVNTIKKQIKRRDGIMKAFKEKRSTDLMDIIQADNEILNNIGQLIKEDKCHEDCFMADCKNFL